MTYLWVLAALIASAGQVARNAAQTGLTQTIGTLGATQVRFLFGLPFALLFLPVVMAATGEALPALTPRSLAFVAVGAVAQIAATALMLVTMKSRSFAVTTAWLKTEPVIVAVTAAVILGDPLTATALLAILIAIAGVVLLSVKPGVPIWRESGPALTGILSGALFGASAVGFRGGIIGLEEGSFLIRATAMLALNLSLQTALLTAWLLAFNRPALTASFRVWRASLWVGFVGATASLFWFIGFSLTSAANVRTLALIEVVMALGVARYVFGQKITTRQMLGMAVMMAGVALLLRSQG